MGQARLQNGFEAFAAKLGKHICHAVVIDYEKSIKKTMKAQ